MLPCAGQNFISKGNMSEDRTSRIYSTLLIFFVLVNASIPLIVLSVLCFSARDQDLEFARIFATVKSKPVPVPTYLLFTARNGITVAASFNMPGPVSKYLQNRLRMSQKNADVTAQVFASEAPRGVRTSC